MRSFTTVSTLLLLLGCASDPVAGPQVPVDASHMPHAGSGYTVRNISSSPTDPSYGWSINADQQVAGWSLTPSGSRAWVWAGGVTTLLPLPRGAVGSQAYGISNDGRIVGSILTSRGLFPAYWRNSVTAPVLLPTLGYVTGNIGLGVNSSGRVAGLVLDRNGQEQAFVWEASTGAFGLLGTLGGLTSRANDVNDGGTVTGCADDPTGNPRAYRWTSAGGMVNADRYAGSTGSCGQGLNRQADVAGHFYGGPGGTDTAAVFDASGIPLLAARIGGQAWYWSVNDNGVAAGYADTYALGLRQAIVYQPSAGISVLPSLSRSASAEAHDINGCGRIVGVGYGVGGGPDRALLWVPTGC
ncbi:MAG: hypothetical protein ABI587_09945 [Gemmatimonadales bacterium]